MNQAFQLMLKEVIDNKVPGLIKKLGSYINPLLLKFRKENKRLLAFSFHGLFESDKQKALNHIDPQNNMLASQFREFIDYFLSNKYKFISPEDILAGLDDDQPYAMITFDDGYFNNYLAIDVLRNYQIPAVFFIATRFMVENRSYWWDVIYKYRRKQGSNIDTIRNEQKYLKGLKSGLIEKYILENFGVEAFKPWSDVDRPFNENEVKSNSKNPFVSFGNHTHNHAILTRYTKEEIKEEFRISNNILFDLTETRPITIAFPNGNFNDLVLEATEEEGFRFAFTTKQKGNYLPFVQENLVCLNRFMTLPGNISRFGNFWRLDYLPDGLYSGMKNHMAYLMRRKSIKAKIKL
jgi:peptidoglycan/xylan/chitin deacetylase (PgdA/CDA1 family)